MAFTKSTYLDLITETAGRNGLDPALSIAMAQTESDFDANAVSRSGATGLMQLMPALAEQYRVPDPLDPAQNLDGESRYFKDRLTHFNGNAILALAACNAVATTVIAHEGMPPFRKPSSLSNELWPYIKPTKYSNPCIIRFV